MDLRKCCTRITLPVGDMLLPANVGHIPHVLLNQVVLHDRLLQKGYGRISVSVGFLLFLSLLLFLLDPTAAFHSDRLAQSQSGTWKFRTTKYSKITCEILVSCFLCSDFPSSFSVSLFWSFFFQLACKWAGHLICCRLPTSEGTNSVEAVCSLKVKVLVVQSLSPLSLKIPTPLPH